MSVISREMTDTTFQIPALDGLRGFAALLVVVSHTSNVGMYFLPFLDMGRTGRFAVFLFFVLSSFLLALPFLHKGIAMFSLPALSIYWQRRFFRIYPLYTLYLLLGFISTWFFFNFFGTADVGVPFSLDVKGLIRHLTLQEGKQVTWSIAVEFKFYFLLPVLAWVTVLILPYGVTAATLFYLAALVLSQVIFPQSEVAPSDVRLLPYLPIFIIGMFFASVQYFLNQMDYLPEATIRLIRVLGYLGVAGVLAMMPIVYTQFDSSLPVNLFRNQFIAAAFCWSFVLLSAVNIHGLIQKFFCLPVLKFYGALSFSLYLFHIVFIGPVDSLNLGSHLSAWLVLILSTVTAYISFIVLERPVSRFRLARNTQ